MEHNRIEQLIERFFDGRTTNAEEQELYAFFNRADLSPTLRQWQPFFSYVECDMPAALAANVSPVRRLRRLVMLWGSVAAALIVIFGVAMHIFYPREDPYEGSYIIRGGVRITDPRIVRPIVEAAIREAADYQEVVDRLLNQKYDPYTELIEQLPDEYSRKFLQTIITE